MRALGWRKAPEHNNLGDGTRDKAQVFVGLGQTLKGQTVAVGDVVALKAGGFLANLNGFC